MVDFPWKLRFLAVFSSSVVLNAVSISIMFMDQETVEMVTFYRNQGVISIHLFVRQSVFSSVPFPLKVGDWRASEGLRWP